MESIDDEYAKAVAKHRLQDKGKRPSPIVFSPYTNNEPQLLPENPPSAASTDTNASTPFPFSPGFSSNLGSSVSKLRRTSQFFSRLTNSLGKSPSTKHSSKDRGIHPMRSKDGSHPLERALPDLVDRDIHNSAPVTRSHSEYDSVSSPSPHSFDLNNQDARRDSMYSVRTSVTAPLANSSCPTSPYDGARTDSVSAHYSMYDHRSIKEEEEYMKALSSFNLMHNTLKDPLVSSNDFDKLRETLNNISLSDRGSSKHRCSEDTILDTMSMSFTSDHSEADSGSGQLTERLINDTIVNTLLSNIAPSLRGRKASSTGSYNPGDTKSGGTSPSLSSPETQAEDDTASINGGKTNSDTLSVNEKSESEIDPAVMAKMIFDNNNSLMAHDEIAEFLGKRGEYYSACLKAYMDHFDFRGLTLDNAFRKMCTHLFLQGETQMIDRILAEFARRYWDCNPGSVFRSQDVVYAVSYSMLLLNTDLHVAKNHTKMSRSDFVKNTLSAVEHCARTASIEQEGGIGAGTRIDGRSKSIENYGLSNLDDLTHTLKDMYSSIKNSQILQHVEPNSPNVRSSTYSTQNGSTKDSMHRAQSAPKLKPSGPFARKGSGWERGGNSLNISQMSTRSEVPDLSILSKPNPNKNKINPAEAAVYPYQKVGALVRKHLFERTDKKAAHRTWKDCLVIVERGEIKMYKTDRGKYGGEGVELTDVNLQLGTVSLRHCLAVTLPPPGYSPSRPHVFALQLPSGGVYLFQAPSLALVSEWVVICNFWAARETKEPLPGGICSIDYGWGTTYGDGRGKGQGEEEGSEPGVLASLGSYQPVSSRQLFNEQQNNKPQVIIQEWRPPAPPMVRSALDEDEQLEALMRHIASLDSELVEHMDYRSIIHRRLPPKSQQYPKAFSNWERKSQYLLRELIKYQTYADILKKTLLVNRGLPNPETNSPDDDVLEFIPSVPTAPASPEVDPAQETS